MKKVNWIREELAHVKKWAARNNEHAMYELATRYLTGRDVRRDDVAGLYWACQAGVHGSSKAMVLAGYCLILGIGSQDEDAAARFDEAVNWFEDAARLGNATAYYNLGGCYLLGLGKPHSRKAALVYYKAAARMGCKRAESAIAAVEAADARAISKVAEAARLLFAA